MENKQRHIVYILACKDGTLYTGYTNDFAKRLAMHESGKGAKYTRGRGPFTVKSIEYFPTKQEAMRHEYKVKKWPRAKKLRHIAKYSGQEGYVDGENKSDR